MTEYPILPTVSPDGVNQIMEALQSKECLFPCYLNITPGKTGLSQAIAIMESFDGTDISSTTHRKDGTMAHGYYFKIGDPVSPYTATDMKEINLEIGLDIGLISDGNKIQYINSNVTVKTSMPKFQKYWGRYSPEEIFHQYGLPDQIYADVDSPEIDNSGYVLFFVYEKLGVLMEFYGVKQGDRICPQFKGNWMSVTIEIYDTQSAYSKRIEAERISTIPKQIPFIDQTLGIGMAQFYNQVLKDSNACFQPKKPR
jgi:hypothetical protein